MQQAVVWPNYQNHSNNNVGPPPLLLPPPPPPSLQLLGDINGTRLVLADNKRKQQSSLPIVKIEADCGNSPTAIISKKISSISFHFFFHSHFSIFIYLFVYHQKQKIIEHKFFIDKFLFLINWRILIFFFKLRFCIC